MKKCGEKKQRHTKSRRNTDHHRSILHCPQVKFPSAEEHPGPRRSRCSDPPPRRFTSLIRALPQWRALDIPVNISSQLLVPLPFDVLYTVNLEGDIMCSSPYRRQTERSEDSPNLRLNGSRSSPFPPPAEVALALPPPAEVALVLPPPAEVVLAPLLHGAHSGLAEPNI